MKNEVQTYLRYTGPAQTNKAVATLRGLLLGIGADRTITEKELAEISAWQQTTAPLATHYPFSELHERLIAALADGKLSQEEIDDLTWFCSNWEGKYFNEATVQMQQLEGFLAGISSDHVITMEELERLDQWIENHRHLNNHWPFDEIDNIVTRVLADKIVDPEEHDMLLKFAKQFGSVSSGNDTDDTAALPKTILGICTMCPDVKFKGQEFCITGLSPKYPRAKIAETITGMGGTYSEHLRKTANYLIICLEANAAWAYSSYGRKIEKALKWRKEGVRLLLVHENDFWDSVADVQAK